MKYLKSKNFEKTKMNNLDNDQLQSSFAQQSMKSNLRIGE